MTDVVADTSEDSQELGLRSRTSGVESLREAGAVLRIPHLPEDVESVPGADDTMIINMGPQHPSTHGVLRVMMELQGETVLRSKPVLGYLHTGMEKTGEDLTYLQGPTNTTRMDYTSPMFNELVFSLAVEALLELELPPRATMIRTLMCELNRMSSHYLWLATNGMDLGA
ncbi:MAG: NADH-quinone oxidoreductase subunit D, partial [Acidimicrobiales bacterium]